MKFLFRWASLLAATICGLTANAADFPAVYNSEQDTNAAPPTPQESLAKLKLPPGFNATIFAAEPDVRNPISMAWDARGRLWIAENYTYAERTVKFDLHLRDRILVFEDTNGDGRFDSRKVFTDEVQRVTSVEVGHGGVWAMCPPQLLFIPDRDRDGVPDGPAEVVLDGFHVPKDNYHNFANGLHWGPDGWLYGRCGASAPGRIGRPGASENARLPIHGGIWRYHPQRQLVEVLTSGPMNSWGHDWNEFGELFCVNTVTGHLWHLIPGAHYFVAHTLDPNPHVYELMDMHADHWHFDTAKGWTASRDGAANDYGGGHAHIGAMIYLGDNWPAEYRGHLFTLNMFGRRANQEILERAGSGYVARHGADCFFFDDGWFRGIELGYGPDGGVFVLDWSDTGECHENTGVHRTSGRIYNIRFGAPKASSVDLAKLSASELVKLHAHPNEWFVRQARLELAARATAGRDLETAKAELRGIFTQQTNVLMQLRALWSLYVIGAADEQFLHAQLTHSNEHVRTWAIRLLSDSWPLDTAVSARPVGRIDAPSPTTMREFSRLAKSDSSGLVRLALASALQRLPVSQRAQIAAPLLAHAEDAADHNLPLLLWYGLIPVGDAFPATLAKLARECELPLTRKLMARRLGEAIETNPAPLNDLLAVAAKKPAAFQADILNGLTEALRGWRKARKPDSWDAFQKALTASSDLALRNQVRDLSVLFGDGRALDEVKRTALDSKADLTFRRAALRTLIENRPPDLRATCEKLLSVRFLNTTAVRGLALFDDPDIGDLLAGSYSRFHPSERPVVIETLASRAAFAGALLDEIAAGRIPRQDVTPFHARQIRSFNDPVLTKRLAEVWGQLRDSPAEKQQFIARLKKNLTPATLAAADKSVGRVVFNNACANCHTLYGHGGRIGPELTGSNRDNLDYLLDNLVDPSAVVNADYRMSVVDLKDGRTLNGVVAAKTDRTLTLITMTEPVTVERAEIDKIQQSQLSLMPEGLLEAMSETQVRDLIAYLMHRSQVP
ncbi:MAG TPA: PVC-type heme-binding CxxCH protein [Verrucomicrobiae bacterium]|nr:PVC-type heme-binding CxxCH protein [Verrucomicrobiae bacterium]